MTTKILLVDDDPMVLEGYQRNLRHRFALHTATGTPQAFQRLEEEGPFAVLVVDMRMPGLDGLELLRLAREMDPEMVRIMLTGSVDQRTAIDAVNEGQVFRFLTKPCSTEELALALKDALHLRAWRAEERDLLERTVGGIVSVLTDLIGVVDSDPCDTSENLCAQAEGLAQRLRVPDAWEVGLAARFVDLGQLTLGPGLREKLRTGLPLTPLERAQVQRVPELGEQLLARIPRLGGVARIVRYQAKGYDGSGFPLDGVAEDRIPMGARILRPLMDLAALSREGRTWEAGKEMLCAQSQRYDPEVLAALAGAPVAPEAPGPRQVGIDALQKGMRLVEDAQTEAGRLVVRKGTLLGLTHVLMLRNLAELLDLRLPLVVLDPMEGGPTVRW